MPAMVRRFHEVRKPRSVLRKPAPGNWRRWPWSGSGAASLQNTTRTAAVPEHCKHEEEHPDWQSVMPGHDLRWRINEDPEHGRRHSGEQQHSPAIVSFKKRVSKNVVVRKRKCCDQGGNNSQRIQLQFSVSRTVQLPRAGMPHNC